MEKVKAVVISAMILSGYSLPAFCEDSSSIEKSNAQIEQRIEMEKKQQELTHTEDFVSDKRGERDLLLIAPIKKGDALTNQPSKSNSKGAMNADAQ